MLYTDPSGEYVDTLFDFVSFGVDIYTIGNKAKQGCEILWSDWAALGMDAFSLAIPFLPAAGILVRLSAHADDFGDLAQVFNKVSDGLKYLPEPNKFKLERHHIFPRRHDLAQRFAQSGIDINQHLMELPIEIHKKIHSSGARGGSWNRAWETFFENNPQATIVEIYKYAGWLIHEFGLDKIGKMLP